MKVSQRIRRPVRITPKPVDFAGVDGVHNAVGTKNLCIHERFADGGLFADHQCVAIDARAGHAIESLRDNGPLNFERDRSAGGNLNLVPSKSKTILGVFVPWAFDVKEDFTVHQSGFVEGDPAGAVAVQTDFIDGAEFDDGNATTGLVVDDLDGEWV